MRAVGPSRYVAFAVIATFGCAIDLWTKHLAFSRLGMPPAPRYWVIEGIFGFETALNRGALFGLGQGKVGLFIVMSIVAGLGILVWLFVYGAAREWLLTVALGCVMAGILGNLYDRLGLWAPAGMPGEDAHAVRDWILCEIRGRTWPNFNIADSLLVCGAAVLVWHALRGEKPADEITADQERAG